jgi:hypothetical protein
MELTKRSWPEIVAHIPRNLESGETPSTEPSSSRLGFMLSHIRFDWSRFGRVAVRSFFGSDMLMVRIAEWVIQKLLVKIRQDKYEKNKRLAKSKTIELMRHSATNCWLQLYTQVL